jgi:elongator complex protein 2
MEVSADYLSAGGNRHPSAAAWDSESGLLAFGSGRNIALWSPLVNKLAFPKSHR